MPTIRGLSLHCLLVVALVACASHDNLPERPLPIDTRAINLTEPSALMLAVESGDLAAFRVALASGAQVNGVYAGRTALQQAVAMSRFRMAEVLIKAGADWRLATQEGAPSLLMQVAAEGENALLKQLILKGADFRYRDADGYTALVLAARAGHLTTMKVLLNAGADPNVVADERSVLMHVVANDNALLSQVLIKAGADVNYMHHNGESALIIARREGFYDIDLMLVQAGARF